VNDLAGRRRLADAGFWSPGRLANEGVGPPRRQLAVLRPSDPATDRPRLGKTEFRTSDESAEVHKLELDLEDRELAPKQTERNLWNT
jgi:hypothetical protein